MSPLKKIKPVHDETLTSFLYRSSLKEDQRCERINLLLNDFDCNWDEGFDPDYSCSNIGIAVIGYAVNCGSDEIARIISDCPWLVLRPRRHRKFFCAHCILNDVTCGRHPSWRKTWDSFITITCPEHGIPMNQLDEPIIQSTKARAAFSKACQNYTSKGPYAYETMHLSVPSIGTTAGAWACLWKFGAHIQAVLTMSRAKGVMLRGVLKGGQWSECWPALETILGLSLRRHTRYHECRNLISRVLRSPPQYQVAVDSSDASKKIDDGMVSAGLINRLFSLLILGVFWELFSISEGVLLFKALARLCFSLPSKICELKRELLLSETNDYESIVVARQLKWSLKARAHWMSC